MKNTSEELNILILPCCKFPGGFLNFISLSDGHAIPVLKTGIFWFKAWEKISSVSIKILIKTLISNINGFTILHRDTRLQRVKSAKTES